MPWTYEVPAEPGWYWWQEREGEVVVGVQVRRDGRLMIWDDPFDGELAAEPGRPRGRWLRVDGPDPDAPWLAAQETA